MSGILYGVSIGPGDPELLTIKAVKTIKSCPIIATPVTKGENTLALDITKGAVDITEKEIVQLPFKMTRDTAEMEKNHREVAQIIEAYLDKNLDVAFLNLGDISVYSTFAYIMDIAVQDGYTVKMIPGVTSFCAVAAELTMGLTTMNKAVHIIPASSGISLSQALEMEGTKVLMKSGTSIATVKKAIEDKGLCGKTQLVQNCGLPNQVVCKDISKAKDDASYFTTIIVKE
ncbi:MAG: precorrin-2 C(20)-methyltransferase [Oscillospiraceae bacterium]